MIPSLKNNQEFPLSYDTQDFNEAVSRIIRHKQSVIKFDSILSSADGAVFPGDYTLGRISHNCFKNCTFDSACLHDVAGLGVTFDHTVFKNAKITYALFQNCVITDCLFENCDMEDTHLGFGYISDSVWTGCNINGLGFSGSYMKNCRFVDNKGRFGNMGNACFDNVYFKEHRLTNMNLEYSEFKDVTMEQVTLPFSQMPYIFGGLDYLLNTNDSVTISSRINDDGCISPKEYRDVLKDMIVFFSYKQEYFPLANILLAFHHDKEAWIAVLSGIVAACKQKDFRMCKYYCKLITMRNIATQDQLNMLYQTLIDNSQVNQMTDAQYHEYNLYMPEIRDMLCYNPHKYPTAELRLQTNITDIESEKMMLLQRGLDNIIHLDDYPLEHPSIEISHNSPFDIIIHLCGTPATILIVAALILNIISKVCDTYNNLAQAISNTQEIRLNQDTIELNKLEKAKLSSEIENLELQNEKLRLELDKEQKTITESGIIIVKADMTCNDFNPYKWL
ncbi:MAG: pentapeptide repeat-containing protein [Lachnospiraceae bacterium]|nr:pentapeptide repeat-containing protein [Lachnospiraceae bacterium]